MKMPFRFIETSRLRDLLAAIMQIAVVGVTLGRWKDQSAVRDSLVFPKNVGYFLRERNDALLPVFGKEFVLRFGAHVDAAVGEVEIAPV